MILIYVRTLQSLKLGIDNCLLDVVTTYNLNKAVLCVIEVSINAFSNDSLR